MKISPLTASFCLLCLLLTSLTGCAQPPQPLTAPHGRLSQAQIQRVGQRIWQNECGGTVSGLTSWNGGENFASLGIGHFIWYPAGQRGAFEESFPPLMVYLQACGVAVPAWTKGACLWPTKQAFDADRNGMRQQELRSLLSRTTRQQTEFIIARLQRALPKMLAQTQDAAAVRDRFEGLLATPEGCFCLIDYVNFKGEGTNAKERYQGQGWGLLQVLEGMPTSKTPSLYPPRFAESAKRVLSRRVANAPPARGEGRWLAGWHNRCEAYKRPL